MNKNILIMMRALSNPNLYTRRERAFNAKEISDVYLKKSYNNNDWGSVEDLCQHEDVEELDLIYRDRDDFIKSVENEVAHMEEEINKLYEQKAKQPYIGLTKTVTVPEFTLPGGRSRWFRYLFKGA